MKAAALILPKTSYASLRDMREWMRRAPVGSRMCYGHGSRDDSLGEPAGRLAAEWQTAGLASLFKPRSVRDPGIFDFIAVKLAPAPGESPAQRFDSEDLRVLHFIAWHLGQGQDCPSNAAIAEACGLRGDASARYRVQRLERLGALKVVGHRPFGARVVELGLVPGDGGEG